MLESPDRTHLARIWYPSRGFAQKRKRKPRIARIRADDTEFLRVPSVRSVNPRNPLFAFRFLGKAYPVNT